MRPDELLEGRLDTSVIFTRHERFALLLALQRGDDSVTWWRRGEWFLAWAAAMRRAGEEDLLALLFAGRIAPGWSEEGALYFFSTD